MTTARIGAGNRRLDGLSEIVENARQARVGVESSSRRNNDSMEDGGDSTCISENSVINMTNREVAELTELLKNVRRIKLDLDKSSKEKVDLRGVDDDLTHLINLIKLRELLIAFRDVGQSDNELKSLLKNTPNQTGDSDSRVLAAAESFTKLSRVYKKMVRCCPEDNALRKYVTAAHDHWSEILYDLLSKRFDKICQEITITNPIGASASGPVKPVTAVFDHFFQALLKIDTSGSEEPCLPMVLLVKQLEKRFYFFFMRPSKTNQLSKPEWYFTQVLNWIKESERFLDSNVNPILRAQSHIEINLSARVMLTICLLKLVRIKLANDLDELVKDPALFSHCYDELLAFVKELEAHLGDEFIPVQNSVDLVNLFMDEPHFSCLMRLERKKAIEYIESIFQSPDSWFCLSDSLMSESEEDCKIPQIADQFVLLLQAVIDRTYFISLSARKQAYILLIIDLIDDFRLRLYQLVREMLCDELNDGARPAEDFFIFPSKFFAIMNTLDYLIKVITHWSSALPLLQTDPTILQDSSDSLLHIISDMESRLVDSFEDNLEVYLDSYSDVSWFSYDEDMDDISLVESSLLLFISRTLSGLNQRLSKNLTKLIASVITKSFTKLFIQVVISRNKFNNGAIVKIKQLVTRKVPDLFKNILPNPAVNLAE